MEEIENMYVKDEVDENLKTTSKLIENLINNQEKDKIIY
jgi:hypothetical protein